MNRAGFISSLIVGVVVIMWRRESAQHVRRFYGFSERWQQPYEYLGIVVGSAFVIGSLYALLFG